MSRKKEFNELETKLRKKFVNIKENEVILREEDFEDGKLTKAGYVSLKLQSFYVPTHEFLEVKIPANYINGFKEQLEYVATKELIRIKADRKQANTMALILFLVGGSLLALPAFLLFFRTKVINEVIIITSWVFVWASIEKKFFETASLKGKRENILHILSSKIITY
ncbi:MAG: hypothetical protein WC964_03890 [Acholeplasmataceae bacterium]